MYRICTLTDIFEFHRMNASIIYCSHPRTFEQNVNCSIRSFLSVLQAGDENKVHNAESLNKSSTITPQAGLRKRKVQRKKTDSFSFSFRLNF